MSSSTPPASKKRFVKQASEEKTSMVKVKKGLSSTPLEKVLSPWTKLKTKQWLDIQLRDSLGFDNLGFTGGGTTLHNELLREELRKNATKDFPKPNDRDVIPDSEESERRQMRGDASRDLPMHTDQDVTFNQEEKEKT